MSLIHIDSTNRVVGSYSSFKVNIDQPKNGREYSTCTLIDCAIPQTWYNISSELGNNTFYYTEYISGATVEKSIVFPDGSYSLAVFVSTYQTFMKANTGYTYAATFPYYLGAQSYAPILIFQIPTVTSPTPWFSILWSRMPKLAAMLGFDPIDSTPSYTVSAQAVRAYNMNIGLGYAYLRIQGLPDMRTSFNQNLTATFPICLFGNSLIISGPVNKTCIDIPPRSFRENTYAVELRRADGGLLGVQTDWQFTLGLY